MRRQRRGRCQRAQTSGLTCTGARMLARTFDHLSKSCKAPTCFAAEGPTPSVASAGVQRSWQRCLEAASPIWADTLVLSVLSDPHVVVHPRWITNGLPKNCDPTRVYDLRMSGAGGRSLLKLNHEWLSDLFALVAGSQMWVVIQCRGQCSLRQTPITLTSPPILQCKEVLPIYRVGRVRMQCQRVLLTFRLFLMCRESLINRSCRVLLECAVLKLKEVLIICRVGRVLIEHEVVLTFRTLLKCKQGFIKFRAGRRILMEFKAVTCREGTTIWLEALSNCKQVLMGSIQVPSNCKKVLMQCIQVHSQYKQVLMQCIQVPTKSRVLMEFEATLIKFSGGVNM